MPLIKFKTPQLKEDKAKEREYTLTTEIKFDAAHRLSNYQGKCERIHGHTYRVVVEAKSNKLNEWGAVIDFGNLKKLLEKHIEVKYDHKLILKSDDSQNYAIGSSMPKDWIFWMDSNPTAENMARDIYKNLLPAFNQNYIFKGVKLVSVAIYETETNKAIYKEEI